MGEPGARKKTPLECRASATGKNKAYTTGVIELTILQKFNEHSRVLHRRARGLSSRSERIQWFDQGSSDTEEEKEVRSPCYLGGT